MILRLFGFVLTALYVPYLAGGAVVPRWAWLAIVLPLLVRWPRKVTLAHVGCLVFIAWAALSLIWTPNRLDGLNALFQWMVLAQAFWLGAELDDLDPIFVGMGWGLLPSSVVTVWQLFDPLIVQKTSGDPSGLFVNSLTLATTAALVVIALIWHRRWILAAALLPTLILPQSRSAWLGLIAAAFVWLWGRSRALALALIACGLVAVAVSFADGYHVPGTLERVSMTLNAMHGLTWLGHGAGSFWTDFAFIDTLDVVRERPDHLHNDWLELVFEYGLVGAVIAASAGWVILRGRGLARLVAAALATEALVVFALHVPTTCFLAGVCLGHMARDLASVRGLFDAGRSRGGKRLELARG